MGKSDGDHPTSTKTRTKRAFRYFVAEWVLKSAAATLIAIMVVISIGSSASAFDCLAYKPAGAQGQWHAEVVAGKICWYGANWRSFLPKPKPRVESSHAANGRPEIVTAPSDRSAAPTPLSVGATDAERPRDVPALRAATPAEAAALINAVSLEFDSVEPEPIVEQHEPYDKRHMTGMIIALGALAIGGLALAIVIYKRGKRRAKQRQLVIGADAGRDGEDQWLEPVHVSPPLAAHELPDLDVERPPAQPLRAAPRVA
jgi:hypothetical protein